MLQERDDVVALDSAIIQHPRTWEASGHLGRLHRPAGRLPHLQAALPRRPPRGRSACGRKPSKHPGETADCDLTEARDFNLMFETTVGPGQGRGLDRLPAARDRPGHLPQLQELPAVQRARSRRSGSPRSARASATRSRPATSSSAPASSSRWRWSSSCRPTEAEQWFEHWTEQRDELVHALGIRARPPAAARPRRRRALALLERHQRRRVPVPDRLAGARGDRQPRRLRPHRSTPSTRARSSSTSTPPAASATSPT